MPDRIRNVLKGIQGKAILAMLIIGIIPSLILGIVSSNLYGNMLKDKIIPITESSVTSLSLNLKMQTQIYLSLLNECASSPATVNLASTPYKTEDQKRSASNVWQMLLSDTNYYNKVSYPFDSVLITKDKTIFALGTYSSENRFSDVKEIIEKSEYYSKLIDSSRTQAWVGVQDNLLIDNSGQQLFFAQNILNDSETVGVLLFCVDLRFFDELITNAQISNQSSMFLVDRNNQLIVESHANFDRFNELNEEEFFTDNDDSLNTSTRMYRSKEYLVVRRQLDILDDKGTFAIILIIPRADLLKDSQHFNALTIGIIITLLVVTLYIIRYVNTSILRPVVYYSNMVNQVGTGNLNVAVKACGGGEILRLGQDLNHMLISMRSYINALQQKEQERRNLEIQTLTAQINPHFVKNTLNAIRLTAELSDVPVLAEQIRSFVGLFDYIFKVGKFTTVKSEVVYLTNYMSLQNLRYQNKFYFHVYVDESLMDVEVPSLVFQPIVENSIIHGFVGRKGSGTISMRGKQDHNCAIFEFEDDGVGLTEVPNLCGTSDFPHGLNNIQRRIKLQYGEQYGIEVTRGQVKGTVVTVRLPIQGGENA